MDEPLKRPVVLISSAMTFMLFFAAINIGAASAYRQRMLNRLRELDAAVEELELSPIGSERMVVVELDKDVTVCGPTVAAQRFGINVESEQNIWVVWKDGDATRLSPRGYDVSILFSTAVIGPGTSAFGLTRLGGNTVDIVVQAI